MQAVKSKTKSNNGASHAPKASKVTESLGAKRQAAKILKALDEANQIHSCKKPAKSFTKFLEEL